MKKTCLALHWAFLGATFILNAAMLQTGLANDIVASAAKNKPGATMSFMTLQAEDAANRTNGKIVRLTADKIRKNHIPEQEAVGRAHVELAKTGDYVEFTHVPAFNGLVIRHCIPDAPTGGGITASLSIYVNGKRRQSVALSSKYNWLYNLDIKGSENGRTEEPTPFAHSFWDESRFLIEGGVKAGDTVRLQKDPEDKADFYLIDLIDVEMVSAPLPRPENSLSIADYGANGKDAADDTAAIQKCIDDAKAQGKIVWMPAGTYLQNASFTLDGVKVQGAGVWYTSLFDTIGNDAPKWSANGGFRLDGDGSSVSDLYIDSTTTTFRTRKGPKPFLGTGKNWRINNVWITHTNTGLWMGGENGVATNLRIHGTYADGININNSGKNILIENNHVRGTGDDGLAILNEVRDKGVTTGVIFRHNTVEAVRWGADCDLAGGTDHIIEDNIFADGRVGFTINMPGSYPMKPLTSATIRRNLIERCGVAHHGNQLRGAIWIYPGSNTISGVVIEDNQIIEPLFFGIQLHGAQSQQILFKGNVIDRPGDCAIKIDPMVKGTATFEGTVLKNIPEGRQAVINNAAADQFNLIVDNK